MSKPTEAQIREAKAWQENNRHVLAPWRVYLAALQGESWKALEADGMKLSAMVSVLQQERDEACADFFMSNTKLVVLKAKAEKLVEALKTDEDYRRSWSANIAMAFKDEWQRAADDGGLPATPDKIHVIANKAAEYFLWLLCK